MKKATTHDAAEFPETDEGTVAYHNATLDDGDSVLLSAALGDIARAQGMTRLTENAAATPIETVDDFLRKSALAGNLSSEAKRLGCNVATEVAMAEARDIMAGKTTAKVYATVNDLFAALDDERS